MLLNNLVIIEQLKEFKMRYILKMGVDFAFEADSPAEFLKLWPRGRRTAYQDDSIKCRRDWAQAVKQWYGKNVRYHNDSALVADLFKYNILEIITHRANWELKKLEKLKDCEGLYHIKIDLDEINKNCEYGYYNAWRSNQLSAYVQHSSIYSALRLIFGVSFTAEYKSELDRDFLDSTVRDFCIQNEIELPFNFRYFKTTERWAKEVLLYLVESRIVRPKIEAEVNK